MSMEIFFSVFKKYKNSSIQPVISELHWVLLTASKKIMQKKLLAVK